MLYFHAVRGADAGAKINNPSGAVRTRQNIQKPHRVRAVRPTVDISTVCNSRYGHVSWVELSWFYLAIINIHLEKTQINARTLGHWRNRKVVDSMPLISWISFVTVQFQLVVVHICGMELLDDQHSYAGVAGSQPVSLVTYVWCIVLTLEVELLHLSQSVVGIPGLGAKFDRGYTLATSPVVLRWLCDSPRTGCAWRITPLYM